MSGLKSAAYQDPRNQQIGQMMHVLVEAEREPEEFVVSLLFVCGSRHLVRAETFVATKHSRAGLDAVHGEVNDEVQ